MRRDQQCSWCHEVCQNVFKTAANGMAKPTKFRVHITEFITQPIQLGNDFLDFPDHRADDSQVTGAVLAHNGFVPDSFGAEGTLHQSGRYFLSRLNPSSSRLALDNSSRAASRFRNRSFRSSINWAGTATSREQALQTSASGTFSWAQNGQTVDMAIRVLPSKQSLCFRYDHPNA